MKDEKIIIEEFLAGNEDAFAELVERYAQTVFYFLLRFVHDRATAEDLAQETFLKVWKNIKKFDSSKNFKTWLFTIAKNTAFDYLKKRKDVPFSSFFEEGENNKFTEIVEDEILSDSLLHRKDAAEELKKALEKIPEAYQIILNMHYQDDFSLQEIAEILDLPYNTVKSQHGRALTSLRKVLEKEPKGF